MKRLTRENSGLTERLPIKVVQFGEGNFLRAFVDYIIEKLNSEANFNAGVVVVQPIANGLVDILNEQEGLYSLFMRGIKDGKEIQERRTISCIQKGVDPFKDYDAFLSLAQEEELRFLISNTTEAGISFDEKDTLSGYPHNSFPAKVTALLYKRFHYFEGAPEKGLTIIPCELINYNADRLREIILKYSELWNLESKFVDWIKESNDFHNTLVDRIVPGYPRIGTEKYLSQIGFEDKLMVTAEVFLLWVIEGGEKLAQKIPFHKIEENVLLVKDMQPYRTRKVRILNGAHTTMVPFALLYGNETVKETIDDDFTGEFVKEAIFEEIIPTLSLPSEELQVFSKEVLDRFRNPFIEHQLASIALNSVSKFKVRVLPSLLAFQEKNEELPVRLTYAFACLIRFYKGEWKGHLLPVKDETEITHFFRRAWEKHSYKEIAQDVLQNQQLWDQDLTHVPNLKLKISMALELIESKGVKEGFLIFTEGLKVK